jgi:hypothetical protein
MNTEIFVECWQQLLEYIPRKEQKHAAEQIMLYLDNTLETEEIDSIISLDVDLSDAYSNVHEEDTMEDDEGE